MNSKDIARLAGVSRSTVSRVLNNYDDISAETRKRVWDVIRQYDYVPNTFGRGLTGKAPQIIGVFIVDLDNKSFDTQIISRSQVFTEFIAYFADIAYNLNYNILLSVISETNLNKIQQQFDSKSICAGIILGDTIDQSIIDYLGQNHYIAALHNICDSSPYPNIITVNVDNETYGYQAARRLLENGHRRIGLITGSPRKYTVQMRTKGVLRALEEYQVPFQPEYVGIGDFHRDSGGYDALDMILKNGRERPTALLVSNSVMLEGVMERLKEEGLTVPEDMSVVAIGGSSLTERGIIPVTDYSIDTEIIASAMISKTTQLLEMGSITSNKILLTGYDLIENDSICPEKDSLCQTTPPL